MVVNLFSKNFCWILFLTASLTFACTEKISLISASHPLNVLDTVSQNNDTIILVDTILNPIDTNSFSIYKNGTVYFQCDFGPYNFTLDSLLINGNFNGNLKDTAFHLQYGIQPNMLIGKHYDYEKQVLQNLDEIDFTVERVANNYNLFAINPNFLVNTTTVLDYVFENDTLQQGYLPYYNGLKVSTSTFCLELYFFNKHIGGCYHDEMVWYYYQ